MVSSDHHIDVGPQVERTSAYSVFEGMIFLSCCTSRLICPSTGQFESPMTPFLGDLIPREAQTAKFQLMLPNKWPNPKIKPLVIHLAGTGDHYFGRRRVLMAKPLLKEYGIGSIILENPFCKLYPIC